ncbi:prolyl oligopeptidase family serine peptidase [Elizabethkingia argentiflava]|uniref:Prolyl oligopeptidase family serine peptidase n=1 Tax=Elizabethkingia argenteiflava TaxID=2681556 RepID=A0A845PWM2_9FLAO|nr:S9 family peptidase [Elizabethkingia argenteiflava]NAW51593.1 prolyl oligopeptidase family serine peptidase [Elizabethkingia argenteiflava]
MKLKQTAALLVAPLLMNAQNVMTPEKMWALGKFSVQAVAADQSSLIYNVGVTDLKTEKTKNKSYFLDLLTSSTTPVDFGKKSLIQWDDNGIYAQEGGLIYISRDKGHTWTAYYRIGKNAKNIVVSPDGKKIAFSREVHIENILGKDKYKDTPNTSAQIYTDLNNRHWDTWYEGRMSHVFIVNVSEEVSQAKDLLNGKKIMVPQQPFGGKEDFIWSPDSQHLLYVTKEKYGAEYAQSTNTDIFAYHLVNGHTENITQGMSGYDLNPKFSPDGRYLAWQSMKTEGYESDKNDIIILDWQTKKKTNLTKEWDETVDGSFFWANDSKTIYFNAAYRAVQQLFSLNIENTKITQITKEQFDVNGIFAQIKSDLLVSRTDFNHSEELFKVSIKTGDFSPITHINRDKYASITPSKSDLKMVKTSDGKEMGVWFIYPPNFNPHKKYPTLLYCQGGPQSAVTQFFSSRWNMALMAAQGYIVVAPNRRGMPGWGVEWNAAISKDWGGQPIRDYLSAADFAKTLPYVDGNRMGAVGASYGGYSVFMLAGMHENRFKTFIAHDGLFDMKSWYGTTEELWFANYELGGSYWENPNAPSYTTFNPSNYINKWNKPIMIVQGGLDFRVPYEQGQQAFQAAKLKGLKVKMLYFPNENHWVLHPQNALVWQREFFEWLKETL